MLAAEIDISEASVGLWAGLPQFLNSTLAERYCVLNSCHIFTVEWLFKLSVNAARNWYRICFFSCTQVENTPAMLTGNHWAAHSVVCHYFVLIVMPYFTLFFSNVLFDKRNGLIYVHKGKSEAAFLLPPVLWEPGLMCGGQMKQQCWQHILICWLWPNGSKVMAGCTSLITISTSAGANPGPLANLFFFFLLFLHHHGSRFQVGFLFPVQAECRLWAKEQYCVHRAGKKLHVASHDIMQENYVCFQPRVDVYLCIHVVREKQPFRVCVPLPNQMNDIIYVMN